MMVIIMIILQGKKCSVCNVQLTVFNTYHSKSSEGVCKNCVIKTRLLKRKATMERKRIQKQYLNTHKEYPKEKVMYYPQAIIIDTEDNKILKIDKRNLRIPSSNPILREDGSFKDIGYSLNSAYNWQIVLDDQQRPTLIATLKKT